MIPNSVSDPKLPILTRPPLTNLASSQMTAASFAPAVPAQGITAREQVDKKALLIHLAAQIRTAQTRLEQCERQQDSSRVAEIFFQKLAYEDLQQRITRGEFDCLTAPSPGEELQQFHPSLLS